MKKYVSAFCFRKYIHKTTKLYRYCITNSISYGFGSSLSEGYWCWQQVVLWTVCMYYYVAKRIGKWTVNTLGLADVTIYVADTTNKSHSQHEVVLICLGNKNSVVQWTNNVAQWMVHNEPGSYEKCTWITFLRWHNSTDRILYKPFLMLVHMLQIHRYICF